MTPSLTEMLASAHQRELRDQAERRREHRVGGPSMAERLRARGRGRAEAPRPGGPCAQGPSAEGEAPRWLDDGRLAGMRLPHKRAG